MADAQKAHRATRPTLGLTTVVQDDFGRYRLGLADDITPGFESRTFAVAVLATRWPHVTHP